MARRGTAQVVDASNNLKQHPCFLCFCTLRKQLFIHCWWNYYMRNKLFIVPLLPYFQYFYCKSWLQEILNSMTDSQLNGQSIFRKLCVILHIMLYFLKLCFIMFLKLVSSRPLDIQNHFQGTNHMCKVLLCFLCFWVALVIRDWTPSAPTPRSGGS